MRAALRLSSLAVLLFLASTASADWDDRFGFAGPHGNFDGGIYNLYVDGADLYVVGAFTHVDGMPADGIVHWDGSAWDPMGSPTFGGGDEIYAITSHQGDIVVAGQFSSVNGQPGSIASWDGSTWSSLGDWLVIADNAREDIFSLASDGTNLYVGGEFPELVMGWDGTDPIDMVEASSSNSFPGNATRVWELCMFNGDLIAAGEFFSIDEVEYRYIARWDGVQWNAMASGSPGSHLTNIFVDQGTLYAQSYAEVWEWTGTDWNLVNEVTSGCTAVMSEFADGIVFQGDLYRSGVGGSVWPDLNGVARWTGSAWDDMRAGVEPMDYCVWLAPSLVEYEGKLLVGGDFTEVRSLAASNLVSWTGEDWYINAPHDVVRDVLTQGNDVYVGGDFTEVAGLPAGGVARWYGNGWATLGDGVQGSVHALLFFGGDLHIAGDFVGDGGIASIARWDGHHWNAVGEGSFAGAIETMATDGANLYVGGGFALTDGTNVLPRVARWDGSQWHALGAGVNDGTVLAMENLNGELFIGGEFTTVDNASFNRVAKWDGNNWSALKLGHDATVRTMTVHEGELYVGGDFHSVPGYAFLFGRVARWDGTNWQRLTSPYAVNGPVHGLASSSVGLAVVGDFDRAGGDPVNRSVLFDGQNWQAMGSGIEGLPTVAAAANNDIYVGGDFAAAGGYTSSNFAHWNSTVVAVPELPSRSSQIVLGSPYPNPFNPSVRVEYELTAAALIDLAIYDTAGRRVRTLENGSRQLPGSYFADWDGRSDKGLRVASGIYFLRLNSGRDSATRRIVLLK